MMHMQPLNDDYMKGLQDGHNNCLRKLGLKIENEIEVLTKWQVGHEYIMALKKIEQMLENFEWVGGDIV